MAYRLNTNDLIKKLSNANTVVNNWDVLCSYDLQSLNKILLEEYKKHPVNTRLQFMVKKKIERFRYEANCDIQLGSPSFRFSTVESGKYDLQIPMEKGSYCNITAEGQTTKRTIPSGYTILTSGPLGSVKGNEWNRTVYAANEIVEFGNEDEATIILHFGEGMGKVSFFPKNIHEDFQTIFDDIRNNFEQNIKAVNYNLVQIRKDTPKKGLILTPKSFIFTTMADVRNKENGALNIWVQTNESGRSKGNPDPSFYPHTSVLPVPLGHSSTLIFSHELIYHKYLKPALEKSYKVTFSDVTTPNGIHVKAINLVPVNSSNQYFFKRFPGIDSYTYEFNIDLNITPFQIYTNDDSLRLVWKYEIVLEYEETKVIENISAGVIGGSVAGTALGALFLGPVGAIGGLAIGFGGGSVGGGIAAGIDRVRQEFTVTLSIDKPIPFVSKDNTQFSAEINLQPQDLNVGARLTKKYGYRLFKLSNAGLKTEELRSYVIGHLQNAFTIPKIDFGSLDYFAEANILFNEGRFKISANKAIHFPYDTVVIGDIDMPHDSKHRYKRENNMFDYPEGITSSATTMASPINSVVNWLTHSFNHIQLLNPFRGFNKIFALPQTTNNNITNVAHFDMNSSLLLGDLLVRTFTREKPYYSTEKLINYTNIKANALNIVTEYENLLEKYDLLSAFPEFDPLLLMSMLEKEIINGNLNRVLDILYKPVFDTVVLNEKINIRNEIRGILVRQEANSQDSYQENLDFIVATKNYFICY